MLIFERINYFLQKASAAMRQAPALCAMTTLTVAAALVVLGLYGMALTNMEGLARIWGQAGRISCYIEDQRTQAEWEHAQERLAALPGVLTAQLLTPEQALARFRDRGPEAAALVEGVGGDVLQPVVEITVQGGFADMQAVTALAQSAAAVPHVAQVDYGGEEFARFGSVVRMLRIGGLMLMAGVAVATALIVANTIRLAVYAQRDEIIILRLVGATHTFIALPFLLQGLAWGLGGGILGAAVLWASDAMVAEHLATILADITAGLPVRLFSARMALMQCAFGAALGGVTSFWAVYRTRDVELS